MSARQGMVGAAR
ncbi:hypothetical protein ZEAMMB73_Zm00001d046582 [Zea mays]|uniref:Uncharacterized protein n=1 Tax=Zea mays TaxID=4577 RepID=A0A1D6P3R7_MAIZE|nr:hypothetical protein ZEAMMB73_Zm00001d046582 [Zea mays]AQL04622.1 hypothetical protein ZEAMMB73_Zm00001d046582 [Zea mays]AQL04625.1 hypothetical protein ZEAMMB73_Zm00001d046582 [Zea mays]